MWEQRVNALLSRAVGSVQSMLVKIHEGKFQGAVCGDYGAGGFSEQALDLLDRAAYWCEHDEPQCEHVWVPVGEGYFEHFQRWL